MFYACTVLPHIQYLLYCTFLYTVPTELPIAKQYNHKMVSEAPHPYPFITISKYCNVASAMYTVCTQPEKLCKTVLEIVLTDLSENRGKRGFLHGLPPSVGLTCKRNGRLWGSEDRRLAWRMGGYTLEDGWLYWRIGGWVGDVWQGWMMVG